MRRDNVKRTNLPLEVIEQQARSLKSGLEKIVGGIHSGGMTPADDLDDPTRDTLARRQHDRFALWAWS
jgi:hypothetical protein